MREMRLAWLWLLLTLCSPACESKDRDFGMSAGPTTDGGADAVESEMDAEPNVVVVPTDEREEPTDEGDAGAIDSEESEAMEAETDIADAAVGATDEDLTALSDVPGPAETEEPPATDPVVETDEPEETDAGTDASEPVLLAVDLVLSANTLATLEDDAVFEVECAFDGDVILPCSDRAEIALSNWDVVSFTDGVFSPNTNGVTHVTATVDGVTSAPVQLTVDLGPICTALRVVGETSAAAGRSVRWTATCDYDDGRLAVDVTDVAEWSSSSEAVASVVEDGMLEAHQAGATTVTVSLANPDAQAITIDRGFAVTDGELVSIRLSPPEAGEVPAGLTTAFSAECEFTDVTIDCTTNVSWESASPTIATISEAGVATGRTPGQTHISASLDGVDSPSVALSVMPPVLVSIAVTPSPNITAEVNTSRRLTATCVMSDGTSSQCSSAVAWESSAPSISSVDASGVLLGRDDGVSLIRATLGDIESPAVTVTVVPPDGCENAISFPDASLLADVRAYTETPAGPIYYDDVKAVTYFEHLTLNGPVSDLTGLRCFTGLRTLRVEESPVEDMSELIGLVRLETLSLRWTNLTSVPNLSELENLSDLNLTGTSITDLFNLVESRSIGSGDVINVQNTDLDCEDSWILGQIEDLLDRGVTVHHHCTL